MGLNQSVYYHFGWKVEESTPTCQEVTWIRDIGVSIPEKTYRKCLNFLKS